MVTADELRKMTPEERIKVLRDIEEERKRELERKRQEVEEELRDAERLISESEEELEEKAEDEEKDRRERRESARKLQEEESESLEELVRGQRTPQVEEPRGRQYGDSLYKILDAATERLEQLYEKRDWSQQDVNDYNRSKQEIEHAKTYHLSKHLEEDIGSAEGILKKLQYR
jgi:hypothetical protein